jgi:hypothetical protein
MSMAETLKNLNHFNHTAKGFDLVEIRNDRVIILRSDPLR